MVRSYQQSLRFIAQQTEIGADYQKWVSKLMGFDFEVHYKPGSSNRVADALSRKSAGEVELGAIVTSQGISWEELEKEVEGDEFISGIKRELMAGECKVRFELVNGKLLYKGRYVIPKSATVIPSLLHEYHDSSVV